MLSGRVRMSVRRGSSVFLYTPCMYKQVSRTAYTNNPQLFVPPSDPVKNSDLKALAKFIYKSGRILVLTGAGISTASGIPDYRSEGVGLYARSSQRPILYTDFLNSVTRRRRYWARNYVGWPKFSTTQPNIAHKILANWERQGKVYWLVTQNVDALHHKAGSRNVTELHGCAHRIDCFDCGQGMTRQRFQDMMTAVNPGFSADTVTTAPDGDVQIPEEDEKQFQVPSCPSCGGMLQPEIVFFGANVARPIVQFVFHLLDECDSVLVVGSSLEVFSGYRFVSAAYDRGIPIAIVNIGKTRADKLATIKIEGQCGAVLEQTKRLLMEEVR